MELRWDDAGADGVSAYSRLIESGFRRLTEADPALSAKGLSRAFHALAPVLASPVEGSRYAASECLQRLAEHCVTDEMIEEAVESRGGPPTAVQSAVAAVVGALQPSRMDGFTHACAVAGAVMSRLGRPGASLCVPILQAVGTVLGTAFEPEDADAVLAQACVEAARPAEGALSRAVRAMGPGPVLDALPLDIEQGINNTGTARTWLLPILKSSVAGSGLAFWAERLMPAARVAGAAASALEKEGLRKRAQVCRALELQIFQLLASFVSWAGDLPEALSQHARGIGAAFANRPDLRPAICHALERMCLQQVEVLRENGRGDEVGWNPMDAGGEGAGLDTADDRTEVAYATGAGHEEHLIVPGYYGLEECERSLGALRAVAGNFLPLLFNGFVSTAPEQRGPLARAVAAYAMVCERAQAEQFFRVVLQKLLKIAADSQASELPRDQIMEGGDSPVERRCTFTELALALAGGLGDDGLGALYSVARTGLSDPEGSIQKKSYKVLGYLCQHGRGFLQAKGQEVLGLLHGSLKQCNSAAKRFRLRAVKALIVAASRPGTALSLPGEDGAAADPEERRAQALTALLSEVVLSLKEVNKKTRSAGYDILIEIGHAVEAEARGGDLDMGGDADEGEAPPGGLNDILKVVLAGLVGQTPHMMSATVMGLARLTYEFAPSIGPMLPQLLPAVLMLLRSKAREVVKSVLGFCKVIAMRLPVDELTSYLRPMLEGMLIWAGDTKNRFKLKVRVIVERLARRCGYDAVAEAMPKSDTRLLAHIRKEKARKQRLKDEAREDAMSLGSRATSRARTARASEWDASRVFSEGATAARGATTARGASVRGGRARVDVGDGEDPTDLLEGGAGRRVRGNRLRGRDEDDEAMEFERDPDGRLVIYEEGGKRRKVGGDGDSDNDSDDDLLAEWGKASGRRGSGAARSVAGQSVGGKSLGGKSAGGRSAGGRSRAGPGRKHDQHSGKQYESKKAGGDVKGKSKLEPYAYWPLDRKLMNRRKSKARAGMEGLRSVVKSKGAIKKGNKAKAA